MGSKSARRNDLTYINITPADWTIEPYGDGVKFVLCHEKQPAKDSQYLHLYRVDHMSGGDCLRAMLTLLRAPKRTIWYHYWMFPTEPYNEQNSRWVFDIDMALQTRLRLQPMTAAELSALADRIEAAQSVAEPTLT